MADRPSVAFVGLGNKIMRKVAGWDPRACTASWHSNDVNLNSLPWKGRHPVQT
jgi:hypothetical protein